MTPVDLAWASSLDPVLDAPWRCNGKPAAATGWSSFTSTSLPYSMADKQPTFSERRETLARIASGIAVIAKDLRGYAEHILSESQRMAAAEKRFAERKSRTARSSR